MLASLSEKVEHMEKTAVGKIGKLREWREREGVELMFELSPAQLEDRQTKMQREVVDAQQGVNFVIVSYTYNQPHTYTYPLRITIPCVLTNRNQLVDNAIGGSPTNRVHVHHSCSPHCTAELASQG